MGKRKGERQPDAKDLRSLVRLGMTKCRHENEVDYAPEGVLAALFLSCYDSHPRTFICETLLLLMRYSSAEVTAQTMCFPLLRIITIIIIIIIVGVARSAVLQLLNHL